MDAWCGWVPGTNLPAVGRYANGSKVSMLGPAGLQIVGNLLVNFKALSAEQTRELYVCVTGSPSRSASQIDAVSLVAAVVGAHKKNRSQVEL